MGHIGQTSHAPNGLAGVDLQIKPGNEALTEPRTRTPLTVKELGPTANRETLQCQMTAEGIIRIRKRVRLVNKALREIHTVYYHTLAMGLRMQGQSLQNIK